MCIPSIKNDKTGVLHEQERDVAKYWMNGKVRIALCGLENQTAVEPKMPLRVFGYEGASYRGQLEEKSAVPVITLVTVLRKMNTGGQKSI